MEVSSGFHEAFFSESIEGEGCKKYREEALGKAFLHRLRLMTNHRSHEAFTLVLFLQKKHLQPLVRRMTEASS